MKSGRCLLFTVYTSITGNYVRKIVTFKFSVWSITYISNYSNIIINKLGISDDKLWHRRL